MFCTQCDLADFVFADLVLFVHAQTFNRVFTQREFGDLFLSGHISKCDQFIVMLLVTLAGGDPFMAKWTNRFVRGLGEALQTLGRQQHDEFMLVITLTEVVHVSILEPYHCV